MKTHGYHPGYIAYLTRVVGEKWLKSVEQKQVGWTPEFVHQWREANSPNFEELVVTVMDEVFQTGGNFEEQRRITNQ